MNKNIFILIATVFLVGGGAWYFMNSQQTTTQTPVVPEATTSAPMEEKAMEETAVEIKGFAFSPKIITVKVGESLTWTNQDSVGHTATADDGTFDTGLLAKGESKAITFSKAGTYTYYCKPHPYMKATVVVE